MVERKLFLKIQSINIMYPNMENMIAMPITKIMEIAMGIQVCLISWMNFDYEDTGGKKAFLASPKHQYRVSRYREHDCCANNKKTRDYYVHPCLCYVMDEL